jgi:coproporphyrinogen III oxidase-like Fe-S oxidoreductase
MSDDTLAKIGRAHTEKDIVDAYAMATVLGFTRINMDVIAGLPGETASDFARTMAKIADLNPSSFTCHTLSIKRGSRLKLEDHALCDPNTAAEMVDIAGSAAFTMGMRPYYLYRQKYMAGNLENVGYAKEGCECVYNIAMMEETRSGIGLGVGSVGKHLCGDLIVRKPNPRDLYVYLNRLPEILEQKRSFFRIDNENAPDYNDPNGDDEDRETI